MKKLITTLALASLATGVFAQGQIYFYNLGGGVTTNAVTSQFASGYTATPGGSGKIASTANGYYFTLLYDTAAVPANNNPLTAGWSQVTVGGTPVIGTNYNGIAGDMQGPKGTTTMLPDNWAAGQSGSFIIVGWSASLGTTWSQVSGELAANWASVTGAYNWFGVSSIGTGTPTASPAAPYNTFGGTGAPTALVLNEVGTVPEPATMALAALGGASLLLFRRKK
jgi:hypothetical protein